MSYSQGNIIFKANQATSGGIVTADNGLTLTGTNVQLGGILIQDTIIDKAGFVLDIGYSSGNVTKLLLDDNLTYGSDYVELSGNDCGLFVNDNPVSGNVRLLLGNNSVGTPGTVIDVGLQQPPGPIALGIMQAGFSDTGDWYFRHYTSGSDIEVIRIERQTGAISWAGGDSFIFQSLSAGAVAFDSANYINVAINGVPYKLALAV